MDSEVLQFEAYARPRSLHEAIARLGEARASVRSVLMRPDSDVNFQRDLVRTQAEERQCEADTLEFALRDLVAAATEYRRAADKASEATQAAAVITARATRWLAILTAFLVIATAASLVSTWRAEPVKVINYVSTPTAPGLPSPASEVP